MPTIQHESAVSLLALPLLLLLTALPGAGLASGGEARRPVHAHEKVYGSGWECDKEFHEVNGSCEAVRVPANAYATNVTHGPGWECKRGYRKREQACAAIEVPENGYLNATGDGWQCDRGFRPAGDACITIPVPANGYLTNSWYGLGWACDRGFRQVNATCVAVKLPENAHLDYSGNDWECDPPFNRTGDGCMPF